MRSLVPWLVLFASIYSVNTESNIRSSAIIFRHGQRTPVAEYPHYEGFQFDEYEPGQLTRFGARQMYVMGTVLRSRYRHLLPPDGYFRASWIKVHSSDVDRCVMSALSFMAGFMPAPANDTTIPFRWQPIALTMDNNGQMISYYKTVCQKYDDDWQRVINGTGSRIRQMLIADDPEIRAISERIGVSLSLDLFKFLYFGDMVKTGMLLGLEPPEWAKNAYEKTVKKYEVLAYDSFYDNLFMTRIRLGVLVNDIVSNLLQVASESAKAYKVQVYSTHDLHLYGVIKVLGVQSQVPQFPNFGDTITIEVLQDSDRPSEFKIRLLYYDNENVEPLKIVVNLTDFCGAHCLVADFVQQLQPYVVEKYDQVCSNEGASAADGLPWIKIVITMILTYLNMGE